MGAAWKWCALAAALAALGGPRAEGALLLPKFLSSHLVLQRGRAAALWGTSECNNVSATLRRGARVVAAARAERAAGGANGAQWVATLPAQEAGTGFAITIEEHCAGGARRELEDVLFGDVFLCSGQSNMQLAVHGDRTGPAAIAESGKLTWLRMWTAQNRSSDHEEWDLDAWGPSMEWLTSVPEHFGSDDMHFPSAVCFFAGRQIFEYLGTTVPVGLVMSTFPGTALESWSAPAALADATCGGLGPVPADAAAVLTASDSRLSSGELSALVDLDEPKPCSGTTPWWDLGPSCLWNGQIAMLLRMQFKAALWYQGEANAKNATSYACRFPAMIADWRRRFQQALPFFFVELAGFQNTDFTALRAAQQRARKLPNVGFGSAIDLGNRTDIHPRDKLEVGRRMSVSILKLVYGAKNVTSATGPELLRVLPARGRYMIVQYALGTAANLGAVPTHDCDACCAESPFMSTQDGGKTWTRAPFHISGVQVIVSHNGTQAPTGLRYAWEPFPQCSIVSAFGGLSGSITATAFDTKLAVQEERVEMLVPGDEDAAAMYSLRGT
jgi:sialate O-acetylesterase